MSGRGTQNSVFCNVNYLLSTPRPVATFPLNFAFRPCERFDKHSHYFRPYTVCRQLLPMFASMDVDASTPMAEATGVKGPRDGAVTRRSGAPVTLEPSDPHAAVGDTITTTTTKKQSNGFTNGSANNSTVDSAGTSKQSKAIRSKYRHVQAVHSKTRPSCLSHDAPETPSFIGFRNLMVIVLGMSPLSLWCSHFLRLLFGELSLTKHSTVAANLRLVIENIQKVSCYSYSFFISSQPPLHLTLVKIPEPDQTWLSEQHRL